MADKNFKVKNKLVINGLAGAAGPLIADASNVIDSTPYIATQYGGTGTTTSPSAGQVLYSSSGTTYTPTTLSSLVQGAKYQADAPSSPATGDIWIESDSNSDSFDPNIIRRKTFTATAGQTAFVTDVNFVDGYEQVYFNGLLLLKTTDYTTSGNNTITLVSAAALNDIIEVVTVTNLNSTNTYTQAEIDAALAAKLSTSTAASTYLTQSNASSTYLTQSNASSTYLTQSNASSTYAAKSNPTFTTIGGNEGGQINLGAAATNTSLSGDISLDIYQNRFRIFESGGSNRGYYLDLSAATAGVGSNLGSSGGMTLLSTTTLSGASVTISSISQDYNNLQIVVQGVTINTNNRNLRVAPNGSYNNSYQGVNNSTAFGSNSGSLVLTGDSLVMDRTNANNIWVINYINYASTTRYKPFYFYGRYQGAVTLQAVMGGGTFDDNTAISSWKIDAQGTDTFAGGTVLIYGVK